MAARDLARALQRHEGPSDQATGQSAEQDGDEGHRAAPPVTAARTGPRDGARLRHHARDARPGLRAQCTSASTLRCNGSAGGEAAPMLARMRTLVVVPTYNEASGVEAVLRRIREELPEGHILVVDDNSPDGTGGLVEAMSAADPEDVPVEPTDQVGSRQRLPGRLHRGPGPGFRHPRGDGRRPVPRPGGASGPRVGHDAWRGPGDRVPLRGGQLDPGLDPPPCLPVALGQSLRRSGPRPGRQRLDIGLSRLPSRCPGQGGPRPRPRLRLRLPGRDDLPTDPARGAGGGDPGGVRRPQGRRVQDVRCPS